MAPAMALPSVCTSRSKDKLGANVSGEVTASTQPWPPLSAPQPSALFFFSRESSQAGLRRSCQSSFDSLHQVEMEAHKGEQPHLKVHSFSSPTASEPLSFLPHRLWDFLTLPQGPATSPHAYLQRKELKPRQTYISTSAYQLYDFRKVILPQCSHL